MLRTVTLFITSFSLFNAVVCHFWWSLVTSDFVTRDQWPSGVMPTALFSDKRVMNRVTVRSILFHSFKAQWAQTMNFIFNEDLHISREWRHYDSLFKLNLSENVPLFKSFHKTTYDSKQEGKCFIDLFCLIFSHTRQKLKDFQLAEWGVKRVWVNAVTPVK